MTDDNVAIINSSDDDDKTTEENEKYDPKLDFFSVNFDPLLALNTKNLKIPVSTAKTFHNIHMYKSFYDKKNTGPSKKKQETKPEEVIVRRWLPSQMPVKSQRTINLKNVLTRMENIKGPLSVLRNCKDNRLKIKVWTRHSHGLRGYCMAYLTAFDKHWNLALEQVIEVWTRPKRRKIPAFDQVPNIEITNNIPIPLVKVIKSDKKTETCTRFVEQFFLRGEHVVMIAVIQDSDDEEKKLL